MLLNNESTKKLKRKSKNTWKRTHNDPNPSGHSNSYLKREVYSKKNAAQPNLTPKGAAGGGDNNKEKPKSSRSNEIMKNRA